MQARSESAPYHQVQDSLDFQLVRGRLRAQEGSPADAVLAARNALKEKRYGSEAAARYALVTALTRARQFKEAESEVQKLLSGKQASPMIQQLAAHTAMPRTRGDVSARQRTASWARSGRAEFPIAMRTLRRNRSR